MASYHLSAQVLSRSDGRSAVAAAAYRAGVSLTCHETGEVHDYARKRGVLDAFILAPADAPTWATDRAQLWDRVHAKERRVNSQLAREIRVALPHELDETERRELLEAWAQDQLVSLGMAVDIAIHAPSRDGDERNVHAHLLCTMREFAPDTSDGWAKNKARAWNETATLERWRSSWAEAQNRALVRAGVEERVDHRSLASQHLAAQVAGDDLLALTLDRPPEPRLGVVAGAIEARARARDPGQPPVTDRGEALAEARSLREGLAWAYRHGLQAVQAIARALRSPANPAALQEAPGASWAPQEPPAPLEPPTAATEPPDEPDPDDALPSLG